VNEDRVEVTVATPSAMSGGGIIANGYIEARHLADVSTRAMGTITKTYVSIGEKVKKGQLLASINNQDFVAKKGQIEASIAEAQAQLANAQKDYERYTSLYNKQSATSKELENVTLQYDAAKAHLETAKQARNEVSAMMSYTSITAPFDGTVTRKLAETGAIASPGMPLFTIEEGDQLRVNFSVGETDIYFLKKGMKAEVEVKATGKKIFCPIAEINPSATLSGGQYIVKLDISPADKKELYAGMYVNVFIPVVRNSDSASVNSVLVPSSSIVHSDQLTGIYTVSDRQTAILRWVRTGKTQGSQVEILSGLAAGEQFISSSQGRLYNGVPVTWQKK
jgi:RND family efflux transporter MFP subunit